MYTLGKHIQLRKRANSHKIALLTRVQRVVTLMHTDFADCVRERENDQAKQTDKIRRYFAQHTIRFFFSLCFKWRMTRLWRTVWDKANSQNYWVVLRSHCFNCIGNFPKQFFQIYGSDTSNGLNIHTHTHNRMCICKKTDSLIWILKGAVDTCACVARSSMTTHQPNFGDVKDEYYADPCDCVCTSFEKLLLPSVILRDANYISNSTPFRINATQPVSVI